ncbi:UNVERIFIED_CONTAM: hypothetical protein RMT77_005983 [Armadillidium vulgare]
MIENGIHLYILLSLTWTHILGWPENYLPEKELKPYEFGYNVFTPETGDFHGHEQKQDPEGLTTGSYYLLAPDGEWQETTFLDSGSGFNAVTKRRPKDDIPDTIRKNKKSLAMYFALGGKDVLFQDSNIGVPVVDRSNFLQHPIPYHFTSPNPITPLYSKPKSPSAFSNSVSSLNFNDDTDTFKPSEFLGSIGPSRPSGPSSPYEGIHVKRTAPKRRTPASIRPKLRFENKAPEQSKQITSNKSFSKSPRISSNEIKTHVPIFSAPNPFPVFESHPFKINFGPFSKPDGKWKIGEMIEDDVKETGSQDINDNETLKREKQSSSNEIQNNFVPPSNIPEITSIKDTSSSLTTKKNSDFKIPNIVDKINSALFSTSTTPLSNTHDIKAITTSLPKITTHILPGIKRKLSKTSTENNESKNTLLQSLKTIDDDIKRFPQQIKFRPSLQRLNSGKSYINLSPGQRNGDRENSIQTTDPRNLEKNPNNGKRNLGQKEFIKSEKNEFSFNKPFESKRVKFNPLINKSNPETHPGGEGKNSNKFTKFKAVSKEDLAKEISSVINHNKEERKKSLSPRPISSTQKETEKPLNSHFVIPTFPPPPKRLQNYISAQQNVPKTPNFQNKLLNQNVPKIPQLDNISIKQKTPQLLQSDIPIKENKPIIPHSKNISPKQNVPKIPQSVLNTLKQHIKLNNSQRFTISKQNVPNFTQSGNISLKQNLSKFVPRDSKFKNPADVLNKIIATTTPRSRGVTEKTDIPKHNIPNLPQIDFDKLKKPGEIINKVNYIHLKGLPPGLLPHLGKQFPTTIPTPKPTNRIVLPREHKIVELLRKLSKERPDLVSTKPINPVKSQPTLPNEIVQNLKNELKSITVGNSDANTDQSIKQETFVVSPLDNQVNKPTNIQNYVINTTTTTITTTTTNNNNNDHINEDNNNNDEYNTNEYQTSVLPVDSVFQKEASQNEEKITREFSETNSRNIPISNGPERRTISEPLKTTVVRGSPGTVKTLNPMPMEELNKVKSRFKSSEPLVVKDFNRNPIEENQYSESILKPLKIDPRNEKNNILSQSQNTS